MTCKARADPGKVPRGLRDRHRAGTDLGERSRGQAYRELMNPRQWVQGLGIQSNDRSMGRVQWSGLQSMEGYRVGVQDNVHSHGSIL